MFFPSETSWPTFLMLGDFVMVSWWVTPKSGLLHLHLEWILYPGG